MEYLAAPRLLPIPLSPQCAHQLFNHVLGLGAGSLPPSVVKMCAEHASPSDDRPSSIATAPQASLITPLQTPTHIAASNDYTPTPTTQLSGLPAYTGVQEFETHQAPALYAIHVNGHNCVFNNQ
jgi:hypothetical protein